MKSSFSLEINLAGIKMKNPVMVASGVFGYGQEYKQLFDLEQLGAIVTKTLTLNEYLGNLPPRLWESESGLINSIGLENIGVEKFLLEKWEFLRSLSVPTIVSIAAFRKQDYLKIIKIFNSTTVEGIEVNISCPNLDTGKMIAQSTRQTYNLIKQIRSLTDKTLLIKLSGQVADIKEIACACEEAGADVLCIANSFPAMEIDVKTKKAVLGNITGGLSGPAIKPLSLYLVYQAYKVVKIPIVGIGGITNKNDALEYFLAGASAIAVGTGLFMNPYCISEIIEGIKNYLQENKLSSISQLVGGLKEKC